MQERCEADIEVEERHHTAQLGQSKPHVDEVWLVPHQQGHRVSLLQGLVLQEDLRYPVTPPVHIPVAVNGPIVDEERFVGLLLRQPHELVQHGDNSPLQPEHLHPQPIGKHFEQVSQVGPEVGEEEFLDEVQGQNPDSSPRYPGGRHWKRVKVVPATHLPAAGPPGTRPGRARRRRLARAEALPALSSSTAGRPSGAGETGRTDGARLSQPRHGTARHGTSPLPPQPCAPAGRAAGAGQESPRTAEAGHPDTSPRSVPPLTDSARLQLLLLLPEPVA